MKPSVIGLDIGGANLKAARSNGEARSHPFELWKHPQRLAEALRELLDGWEPAPFAVTMTGEMCDCFPTKRDGVRHILAEVERAFPDAGIRIWSTAGVFLNPYEAMHDPLAVAASNWHALATHVGRTFAPSGPALLIDIGSTTTDIIPIYDGCPQSIGRTDPDRLESRELVYTGVRRTPICALLQNGVAAELFATILDANLMMGNFPEDPNDYGTADGRPATREFAHARLARMLSGDRELTSIRDTSLLANSAITAQVLILLEAIDRVVGYLPDHPAQPVILAGSGEFLARTVWNSYQIAYGGDDANPIRVVSLAEELGPATSAAACAYAVAVLAESD